ncbi:MAG TPA: AIPR family protein [Croceibacterium sp.]|nr:AIPR family protein [Croceibacterium sp.]
MLEAQLVEEFKARLLRDTEQERHDRGESHSLASDVALAEVMLADLEEGGVLTEHDLCPYEDVEGRNRCKIIAYSLPDESTRLELIIARFLPESDGEYLQAQEIERLAGRAARFFTYAASGDHERFQTNQMVAEAATRIREELPRIAEVRVNILTNGLVRDKAIEELEIDGRPVEFSVWDLERLYRAAGEEVTRDRIEIDFAKLLGRPIPALEMKPPPAEYQTFLLVLPGEALSRLYNQFGARLFEFNVRSFLQARGNVNKGIRETLRNEPERFLAYNNGLTATADEIEVGELNGETVIRRLRGLQIVNGAQTTASIHRAAKVDKIDISRVAVSVKLTRVEPTKLGDFVPLIARFANTQNPVQLADLSANNEFHIAIERLSEQIWAPGEESRWFYERARGAYEVARMRLGSTPAKRRDFDAEYPKNQRFTKTDLAKLWMSWWEQPHVVSRGAQKNFAAFMAALPDRFSAGWSPDPIFYRQTIALLILSKTAQGAVRKASIQSYRANVVTYVLAKIHAEYADQIDLEWIWENQSLSAEMTSMLTEWSGLVHEAIVAGAGARNVTEFCKKEECWERLHALTLPTVQPLPPELSGGAIKIAQPKPARSDPERELIDRCMELNGADWARIVAWASTSTAVTDFDLKVANTIVGYALAGWEKEISAKQAQRGARVLDAAKRAGILEVA